MNRSSILLTGLLLSLLVLLISCEPQASSIIKEEKAVSAINPEKSVSTWEVEWGKTLSIAKKEGKILVYASAQVGEAFVPFSEKYGIKVEMVVSRGAQMVSRLASETRAGLFLPDVYQGGTSTPVATIRLMGLLTPLDSVLILPEVLDETKWRNGRIPFITKDKQVLSFIAGSDPDFAINTIEVKPGEIKDYQDLLSPKWKGKIVINDPTTTGSGLGIFRTVILGILGREKGLEFWRNLAKLEPVITRDQRLQMDWLARGKYAIAIGPQRELINEFQKVGAPIAPLHPFEISALSPGSGNVAMFNKAPHPNAAKAFINWLLTKEGQTYFVKAMGSPSARLDVPTEGVDPLTLPDPKKKYWTPDEAYYATQDEMIGLAREIFGHLLR